MFGLTLDTGALIALERRRRRALTLVTAARNNGQRITVPAPVVVEWWRGQVRAAAMLRAFDVEPLGNDLARIAGSALARAASGPSSTDAVVMASAAQRGDAVLTGDLEDFARLQEVFPSVRLLRV